MAKATWNGVILAETDHVAHVEGNAYFPLSAVDKQYLSASGGTRPTYCHWKGVAEYYDIKIDGETNFGAAWFYREPYPQAAIIKDHVAFWRGVEVTGAPAGSGLVEGEPRLDGKTGWEALCWLIKFSEQTVIPMAEIEQVTGITEGELEGAWQVHNVQRYAARYKRALVGGNGAPYGLKSTA
jgi:uncharacterized protein (DUF427 family)